MTNEEIKQVLRTFVEEDQLDYFISNLDVAMDVILNENEVSEPTVIRLSAALNRMRMVFKNIKTEIEEGGIVTEG